MPNEVHGLDRRDLLMWGVDIRDKAFLADYREERTFWEAGGKKRGSMDQAILYLLAKRHRKVDQAEAEKKAASKPKKELQPA